MSRLPTLVNLHIPRTGGRTRTQFLTELVGGEGVFATIGKDKREVVDYIQMSDEEKQGVRLVTGHMPFLFLKAVQPPKFCITFVRNPLHRSISHYNAFKGWAGHPVGELIREREMSLGDFLLAGIRYDTYDNGMVRYFLDEGPPFMEIGPRHLDEAKRNLCDYIDFVGVTEYMEDSLKVLCAMLGRPVSTEVPHTGNLNQDRTLAGLSPRDRKALLMVNRYDLDFFDFAVERFKLLHGNK